MGLSTRLSLQACTDRLQLRGWLARSWLLLFTRRVHSRKCSGNPTAMGRKPVRQCNRSRVQRHRLLFQHEPNTVWAFVCNLCKGCGLHCHRDNWLWANSSSRCSTSRDQHPQHLLPLVQQLFAGGSVSWKDASSLCKRFNLRARLDKLPGMCRVPQVTDRWDICSNLATIPAISRLLSVILGSTPSTTNCHCSVNSTASHIYPNS